MQAASMLCVRAKDAVTSSDPKQMAESLIGFKGKGRETKKLSYQIQKDTFGSMPREPEKHSSGAKGPEHTRKQFFLESRKFFCFSFSGKKKPKTTLVHVELYPSPPHFC